MSIFDSISRRIARLRRAAAVVVEALMRRGKRLHRPTLPTLPVDPEIRYRWWLTQAELISSIELFQPETDVGERKVLLSGLIRTERTGNEPYGLLLGNRVEIFVHLGAFARRALQTWNADSDATYFAIDMKSWHEKENRTRMRSLASLMGFTQSRVLETVLSPERRLSHLRAHFRRRGAQEQVEVIKHSIRRPVDLEFFVRDLLLKPLTLLRRSVEVQVDLDFPDRLKEGDWAPLRVLFRFGESETIPQEFLDTPIDVRVSTSGFEIHGREQLSAVADQTRATAAVTFYLRGLKTGLQEVRVFFSRLRRYLGTVVLRPRVLAPMGVTAGRA